MNSTPAGPAPKVKKPLTSQVLRLLVLLVTLPYHRFFLYNTLRPVEVIEQFAPHGTEDGSPDRQKICELLKSWRARKKVELEFISIAGVAVTAIVTATLSWGIIETSHWAGVGCFYTSLIMSICGILLSAQQNTLLTLLGEFPEEWTKVKRKFVEGYLSQLLTEEKGHQETDAEFHHTAGCERQHRVRKWRVSWQMVFQWQVAMMAVGYSFLFYIIGLTILICTPLVAQEWGDNSKIAIFYIAASVVSWGIFIYCSLMGYRNVSLDNENPLDDDDEEDQETAVSANVRREETIQTVEKVGN